MDYRGLFEDLIAIDLRAIFHGYYELADECLDFRRDLLARFKSLENMR